MSLLNDKADKEGFIVLYPNGTGPKFRRHNLLTWNAGDCCGKASQQDVDDVGFIRSLLAKLSTSLSIDQKRIFVTGISNGGSMAYRLACEMSDRIAAIAAIAANLAVAKCEPSDPVSVSVFHGTADDHVPYQGGFGEKAVNKKYKKPVSEAVTYWIHHNGTGITPKIEEHGNIQKETYANGRRGTEVILYTIKGGGHSWPGGKPGHWKGATEPTREISATDIMWEFFMRHPKTE
jgi:polyhydroxybutyrate depolymerase